MVSVGASLLPSDDGDNDVARSATENGHEHVGKRSGVRADTRASHARHVEHFLPLRREPRLGYGEDGRVAQGELGTLEMALTISAEATCAVSSG
jgi:hypothetical protein